MSIIFKQIAEIESGHKTQTRWMVKEGETWTYGLSEIVIGKGAGTWTESAKINAINYNIPLKTNLLYPIYAVYTPSGRKKWRIGDICPMIPKRGQKGVGYVRIKSIRLERLGDITEQDALAEGILEDYHDYGGDASGSWGQTSYAYATADVYSDGYSSAIDAYASLWEHVNGIGSWEKNKNDLVWVPNFEYVGKEKSK